MLHLIVDRQSLQLKNPQTGVGVQKSSKVFLVSKNGIPYKLVDGPMLGAEELQLFSHPRVLMASHRDFFGASLLLRQMAKEYHKLSNSSLIVRLLGPLGPRLLIQLREPLEGGLSVLEERGFKELGEGLARKVVVIMRAGEVAPEEAHKLLSVSSVRQGR